jgi:hypothetical protein
MAISRPCYISREAAKVALEITSTDEDFAVDLAISQASDKIDGQLRRVFYPTSATRYFDYPNNDLAGVGELWLDENELISVTTLTSGGQTISPSDYILYPSVPYNRISLNRSTNASFAEGSTYQNNIAITVVFGFTDAEVLATSLPSSITSSQTLVTVADGGSVGVGQLIRVGTERMLVKSKRLVDSTQDLQSNLDDLPSANSVSVTDGTQFNVGEEIYIDAEPMFITAIAGNTLLVKRSTTQLESHLANTSVYVMRQLELIRGATGTTAASASSSASVYVLTPPPIVQQLCLAEAVTTYLQSGTGYARSLGSGSSDGKPAGAGLTELWASAKAVYKRYLTGAV